VRVTVEIAVAQDYPTVENRSSANMRASILVLLTGLCMSPALTAGSEWSGVWRDGRGRKPCSEVRTIDHGGGDVEFQLDLWGGPPADNSGGMEGRVSIKEGKAAFETKEFGALCRIEFTFSSKQLILREALGSPADCGFGNRIFADGTFARTSRKIPTFIHR
jgi:hypothetical protein